MRLTLPLVLLTGLAVVSQGAPEKPRPAVPVLKADAVYSSAVEQVTSAPPDLGHELPTPVSSLEGGLRSVQKVSTRPILAMSESKGWFFYATSVATDAKTGKPTSFISGYAVKRDGRRVIRWSVW